MQKESQESDSEREDVLGRCINQCILGFLYPYVCTTVTYDKNLCSVHLKELPQFPYDKIQRDRNIVHQCLIGSVFLSGWYIK